MASTVEIRRGKSELPAEEQLVVDEFSSVIRKHPDQSPMALVRLVGLAFNHSLGRGGSQEEKLERARARGAVVRQQLTEAEGGSWSSEAVADLLQISKTSVLKRLAANQLLAWREERLQAARFPRWQFDDHGHVLPGLKDVLAVLNQDKGMDVWGKILFFLQEKPSLDGKRPVDLLRAGKVQEVQLAARAYVE